MPYFIERRGESHCVMKGEAGTPGATVEKCHPTREEALAHLRALMSNVPDAQRSDSHAALSDATDVNALIALHDQLLAHRPDGATHDEETCPVCAGALGDDPEGGGWMATFTEEEVQAAVDKAVAEATASLQSRIAELETSQQQQTLEQAVADAKAELEVQIADLQSKLDAAVLEAAQAKEANEAMQQAWDAEKQAAEEAAQLAARRDERLAKVREVAAFPDSYLEENADRFAALSDEEFAARLGEWAAISTKEPPKRTAFTAARKEENGGSALSSLRELRRANTDPRTL